MRIVDCCMIMIFTTPKDIYGLNWLPDGNAYKVTINNTDPNGVSYGTYAFKDTVNTKTFQVAAGEYVVKVEDANGCNVIDTINVAQPDMWLLTTTPTLPTDCGNDDGEIKVDIAGGWPGHDYQISIDEGDNWYDVTDDSYNLSDIEGIEFGEYTIWVRNTTIPAQTNTTACIAKTVETLTEPSEFAYTVTIEDAKCYGEYNGKMIITDVTGGSGKYQFQLVSHNNTIYDPTDNTLWEPNSGPLDADREFVTEFTFDTLDAGNYTLYIRDDAGYTLSKCGALESWEVEEPDSLEITQTKWLKDVTCQGGNDGSFEIMVNGGNGGYKYAYTESHVTPDPTHPYQYMPDVNDASLWQDSPIFTDVPVGTFIAWVVDGKGCYQGGEVRTNGAVIDQHRVVIDEPDTVEISNIAITDAKCYGVDDATIAISGVTGGNGAPYSFILSGTKFDGAAVLDTFSVTPSGGVYTLTGIYASMDDTSTVVGPEDKYTINVLDANGCKSDAFEVPVIDQPEEFVIQAIIDEDAFICANDLSGILDIETVKGGTTPFMYQVYRDDVLVRTWTFNTSHVVESGHNYVIMAKDANDCMAYDTLDIATPEEVVFNVSDITCYNDTYPKARIVVTGGELDRTFFVRYTSVIGDVEGTLSSPIEIPANDTLEIANGLTYGDDNSSDGHYHFYVYDEFGCESATYEQITFVPVQAMLTATFTTDGTVTTISDISGGISPYKLMVGNVDMGPVSGSVVVDSLAVGETVIKIIDAHECEAIDTSKVDELMVTADPASGDAMDQEFDVVLTFNREVTVVEGDITGGTVTPGTGTEFTVSMMGADGDELTLNVGSTIMDNAGNAFAGTSFTYTVGDNTGPMPIAYSPETGSTITDNHPTLIVKFDEDVVFNQAGNILITKVGGTLPTLTIPVTAEMVDGDSITVTYTYDAEIGGLNKNTEYSVTFDADIVADANGNAGEGLSDDTVWTFTTGSDFATGIEDPLSGSLEFKVYPNPFDGYVTVDHADKLSRIIISNVAGQRVKDIVSPTSTILTNDLRSGVYFMTLITKDDVVAKTERIVKR